MICDLCCQTEASIHIEEVINHNKKSINLCESCAAKKNVKLSTENSAWFSDTIQNISLPKIIELEENQRCPLVCKNCRLTLEEFRKTGRLGCPECYKEFRNVLREILPAIHFGSRHKGRAPATLADRHKITSSIVADDGSNNVVSHISTLQKILEDAVATEDFELAAVLRDQIGVMQDQNENLPVTESDK